MLRHTSPGGERDPDRLIYVRMRRVYPRRVTKRLVEIDDADLDAARVALSTSTIRETVGRALREAAASAARRREVERLIDGSSALLAAGEDRDRAWR